VIIPGTRRRAAAGVAALIMGGGLLVGCQNDHPTPGPSRSPAAPGPATSAASPSAPVSPTSTGSGATKSPAPEPTTTNTLPPPKAPTAPAKKTSGKLTSKDLPVPAGWKPVARAGGADDGYLGNGTWTHARDPRYAAQAVITIGCGSITRDDYTDPIHALEGTYGRKGAEDSQPGVGDVLQFRTAADAKLFYQKYLQQVRDCSDPKGEVYAKIISTEPGLIDQRVYDGSTDWTEVAKLDGDRVTLIILTDPGHKITESASRKLLAKIGK